MKFVILFLLCLIATRYAYSQNSPTRSDSVYKIKTARGWAFVVPESRFDNAVYRMIRETKKDTLIRLQEKIIRADSIQIETLKRIEKNLRNELGYRIEITEEVEKVAKENQKKNEALTKTNRKLKRRSFFSIVGNVASAVLIIILIK